MLVARSAGALAAEVGGVARGGEGREAHLVGAVAV